MPPWAFSFKAEYNILIIHWLSISWCILWSIVTKCLILPCNVCQITLWFNRDCQMIEYKLFCGLSFIIRWWWVLCCTMRCFSCSNCVAVMLSKACGYRMTMGIVLCAEVLSCSNCVAIMLLKALHYRMMVGIVSLFEVGEYEQLGTSCAFESPWLARNEPTSGMW